MTDATKHPLTRKQVQALPTEVLGSFLAASAIYAATIARDSAAYQREVVWLRREIKEGKRG